MAGFCGTDVPTSSEMEAGVWAGHPLGIQPERATPPLWDLKCPSISWSDWITWSSKSLLGETRKNPSFLS